MGGGVVQLLEADASDGWLGEMTRVEVSDLLESPPIEDHIPARIGRYAVRASRSGYKTVTNCVPRSTDFDETSTRRRGWKASTPTWDKRSIS